jgi:DNA primase catalytic core
MRAPKYRTKDAKYHKGILAADTIRVYKAHERKIADFSKKYDGNPQETPIMARFSPEEIERIKRETDIIALIQSCGTVLKKRESKPGEWMGRCPIHDDKDPSLCVNNDKNEWICHGACQKGGDVIEWVMHAKKCSFTHAMELLQENSFHKPAATGNPRQLECPLPLTANQQELLISTVNYYHDRLKVNTDALAYLDKRGIVHTEVIDRFKIGFVDRTLGLRVPPKAYKNGSTMREALEEIGILRDTGHEHLRGCIVIPLMTTKGEIVQIYGRRLDNGGKSKQRHFYLPRPLAGVFNFEALQQFEEIILCESIIDALTFWNHGYRNVTCTFGTNGFTDEILDAIQNGNVKRVLIAFDNDTAGNHGAEEAAKRLNAVGIDAFRVKFPAGQDANEFAIKVQFANNGNGDTTLASLGLAIRSATWLSNGQTGESPIITLNETKVVRQAKGMAQPEQPAAKEENVPSVATPTDNQSSLLAANEAAKAVPANRKLSACEIFDEAERRVAERKAADPIGSERTFRDILGEAKVSEPQAATKIDSENRSTVAKQAPAASPMPSVAKATVDAEIKDNEVVIPIGNRSYRVRGLEKNLAFDVLKVNVLVRKNEQFYIDTFDIYAARQRSIFVKEAARELMLDDETIKRDLGKVLLKLEELQDKTIADAQAVKQEKIEITDADKAAAMELLKDDRLIERILADFDVCGVVGEETNKLFGYIAATSRKLDKPLAVMVQSSSAAGKSSLMDAVLGFIPIEEQVTYSAMTGQSLFYMGGMNLKNKILAISEEEGIRQAAYALKLLQSEGQLTIASTGKDPGTGRMETQEYHVEGPVMIFLTTTAIDVDPELLNRCTVLTVNEDREQTAAIHRQQRKDETLEGMQGNARKATVRKLHHNAQRLLRPLDVVNPYAEQLAFLDSQTRFRRDHKKYLTLIRSIALLHQYQRPIKTTTIEGEARSYIEVTAEDITLANRLADAVLGRSIDELPPQTRRLLWQLVDMVRMECEAKQLQHSEVRFLRKDVRERFQWGQTQLKMHLDRLVEMEYVLPHRGVGRTIEYELLFDGRGREGQPTLPGLIDPSQCQGSGFIANHGDCGPVATCAPENDEPNPYATTIEDIQSSGLEGAISGSEAPISGFVVESSGQDRPNIAPLSNDEKYDSPNETKGEAQSSVESMKIDQGDNGERSKKAS